MLSFSYNCCHHFGGSRYRKLYALSDYIARRHKYFTNREIRHRFVVYGTRPLRQNEPRVRFDDTIETSEELKSDEQSEKKTRVKAISRAMSAYLERAKQYDVFMREEEKEFESGRRHLANIMGVDEALMTQADIDLAVQYLMPSGLFQVNARPVMTPPKQLYPRKKEAMFDAEGRPFHAMFYTGKPNFFHVCYEISDHLEKLDQFQERLVRKGVIEAPTEAKIELMSSQWLSYDEFKQIFLEKFDENTYQMMITAFDRLVAHPYSKRAHDFIMKYRKIIKQVASQMEIKPLMYDENGRPYMSARSRRKFCVADVTVRGNGSGKVDINGKDLLYFEFIHDREQVMTPLKFCNLLFKVDIECRTTHEEKTKIYHPEALPRGMMHYPGVWRPLGTSAQSGAIRHALSLALKSFVDQSTVERMRLAGLLTRDVRISERKKWGQKGARAKYTWKKR